MGCPEALIVSSKQIQKESLSVTASFLMGFQDIWLWHKWSACAVCDAFFAVAQCVGPGSWQKGFYSSQGLPEEPLSSTTR